MNKKVDLRPRKTFDVPVDVLICGCSVVASVTLLISICGGMFCGI